MAILKIKERDAVEGSENDQRKKYADTGAIIEERTVLNDTDPMRKSFDTSIMPVILPFELKMKMRAHSPQFVGAQRKSRFAGVRV